MPRAEKVAYENEYCALTQYDSIIIGAGVAGLSAARTLVDAGKTNIAILEAGDRVGGRVLTAETPRGVPIDLGASWFHGREDSELAQRARAAHIPLVLDDVHFLRTVINGQVESGGRAAMAGLLKQGFAILQKQAKAQGLPSADATFDQALAAAKAPATAHAMAGYFREIWASARNPDMSTQDFINDPYDVGGLLPQRGMGDVVALLARSVKSAAGEGAIRLNSPVAAVSALADTAGYFVQMAHGATLSARSVIFTGSVGVIQSGKIDLHSVLTPAMERVLAPENMTMGNMVKVIFDLPPQLAAVGMRHYDFVDQGFFVHTATAGKPILMALAGGGAADRIDGMTPRAVTGHIMRGLVTQPLFQPSSVQDFLAAQQPVITRWRAEPYIQGSYAVLLKDGTRPTQPLSSPDGTFTIAGEAFSNKAGHLDGAYKSGRAAAYDILGALAGKPAPKFPGPAAITNSATSHFRR